jgi:large conductance mechanosensitive channel
MGLWSEFKEFAVKGNAVDMAVGIIIGAAFGQVVSSLVNDVIMPPLGMALGQVDFKDLKVVLKAGQPAIKDAAGVVTSPEVAQVALRYGLFINTVIDFLIVAFVIFILIKMMNKIIKAREPQTKT